MIPCVLRIAVSVGYNRIVGDATAPLVVTRKKDRAQSRSFRRDNKMRQLTGLRMAAVVCLAWLCTTAFATAADVEFPDPNLDQVVREILKKKQIDKLDKAKKITDEDCATIFFLEAPNRGIESLAGLDKCKNLAQVRLTGNKIQDITPLGECPNIQSLDLAKNQIKDIAPVAKLVKLQYLQLDDNQVTSLDPLGGLKPLTAVYLSRNQVKALDPLAQLPKLTSLYLEKNQITDAGPLKANKWLQNLDLRNNQLTDVAPLAALTEMRWTFLDGNKITDIAPLTEAAKKDAAGEKRFAPYWNLSLVGNPLSDASKAQFEALKAIGVRLKTE